MATEYGYLSRHKELQEVKIEGEIDSNQKTLLLSNSATNYKYGATE